MRNFTEKQLKNAIIELHGRNDKDSNMAYRLAFDLLNEKMGDDAFDSWLDDNNF